MACVYCCILVNTIGYEAYIAPVWKRIFAELIDTVLFVFLLKVYFTDVDLRCVIAMLRTHSCLHVHVDVSALPLQCISFFFFLLPSCVKAAITLFYSMGSMHLHCSSLCTYQGLHLWCFHYPTSTFMYNNHVCTCSTQPVLM